jgi:hypothetical protein
MGVDDQVLAFERWSKERGLVTRDVDRKRVAREILELADGGAVESAHVDNLIKRYRDGLMGARSVLAAQRVGQELIEWQGDGGEAEAPAPPPADDREFDFEEPLPPRGRAPTLKDRLQNLPPPPPSANPPPYSDRPPPISDRPPPISDRPPPRSVLSDRPKPWSSSADDFEDPVPSQPRARSRPPASRPPAPDDAFDSEPPPRSQAPKPPSAPPPGGLSGMDLDDAPKKYATGRSRPPSKPPVGLQLPEVEMSEEGVSEERKIRARLEDIDSIAPPPAAPAATATPLAAPPKPLSNAPPALRPVMTRVDEGPLAFFSGRNVTILIGLLLVAGFAYVLAAKPTWLLSDSAKQVTGTFVSPHLGIAWEFPEPWLHDEGLDDDESVAGDWNRAVSVFYHGRSANDFQSQMVVITFTRSGKTATEDDARQLGANETVGPASMRQCEPFDLRGIKGTKCTATSARMGRPTGLLELYFPLDGKAVFYRYQFEIQPMVVTNDMQNLERQQRQLDEQMTDRIKQTFDLVYSMRALKK